MLIKFFFLTPRTSIPTSTPVPDGMEEKRAVTKTVSHYLTQLVSISDIFDSMGRVLTMHLGRDPTVSS